MKLIRRLLGPQPELRIIALLLAVIAILLMLIWRAAVQIDRDIPTVPDAPTVCGDSADPCEVHITH